MKATSKPYVMAIGLFLGLYLSSTTVFAHTHTDACYTTMSHIHTAECYTKVYHKHTQDCIVAECPQIGVSTTSFYVSGTCPNASCPTNQTYPEGYDGDISFSSDFIEQTTTSCQSCGEQAIVQRCVVCGTTIRNDSFNHHRPTIEYSLANNLQSNFACGKSENSYTEELTCTIPENNGERKLICNTIINSIAAKEQAQYGSLNKKIIVTYMDEHTEEKDAESTDYDIKKTYNGDIITLSYKGYTCATVFYSNASQKPSTDTKNEVTVDNDLYNNAENTQIEVNDEISDQFNIEVNNEMEIVERKEKDNNPEVSPTPEPRDPKIEPLPQTIDYSQQTKPEHTTKNIGIVFIIAILLVIVGVVTTIIIKKKK